MRPRAGHAKPGLDSEEAIRDIRGLLEDNRVKFLLLKQEDRRLLWTQCRPRRPGPAAVVNTWDRISVERWVFTAAHELGILCFIQRLMRAARRTNRTRKSVKRIGSPAIS